MSIDLSDMTFNITRKRQILNEECKHEYVETEVLTGVKGCAYRSKKNGARFSEKEKFAKRRSYNVILCYPNIPRDHGILECDFIEIFDCMSNCLGTYVISDLDPMCEPCGGFHIEFIAEECD